MHCWNIQHQKCTLEGFHNISNAYYISVYWIFIKSVISKLVLCYAILFISCFMNEYELCKIRLISATENLKLYGAQRRIFLDLLSLCVVTNLTLFYSLSKTLIMMQIPLFFLQNFVGFAASIFHARIFSLPLFPAHL